jgi:hypothetical protein
MVLAQCFDLGQIVTLAKDVTVALAAAAGVVVAIVGLKSWQRQLRGTVEYQLALKVLRSVFNVQSAIRDTRTRYFSATELSLRRPSGTWSVTTAWAEEAAKAETPEERIVLDEEHAYGFRLQRVQQASSELWLAEQEVMALWGEDSRSKVAQVRECVAELFGAAQDYFPLRVKAARSGERQDPAPDLRQIVFGNPAADPYAAKLDLAVNQAQEWFRRFLK